MKELKLLEDMADAAIADSSYSIRVKVDSILAIAEAFRALEQRAEAAEAKLEKSEPVYQFICNNPDNDGYAEWADCNQDYFSKEPADMRRVLYSRPAPAVSQLNNDAMCDSQYIAGLQAGFVLGDRGDNDSLMRAVDVYRRQLLDSKKSAPAVAPDPE